MESKETEDFDKALKIVKEDVNHLLDKNGKLMEEIKDLRFMFSKLYKFIESLAIIIFVIMAIVLYLIYKLIIP